MDLDHLSQIAITAALAAGKVIHQYMNDDVVVEKKKGGNSYASQVVTEVDRACEAAILAHLRPACAAFDLALLSEETEDDGSRFREDFFWCIDPMDGTLAFINKHPGFAVSIALIAKDGTPVIGVVFDPSTNTLYHAIKGKGAYKNDSPWRIEHSNDHLTYVTDRKLVDTPHSAEIERLLDENVEKLGLNGVKEIAGAGSVMNGILVLENGPACMMKLAKKENGGGSSWDFAATACIYRELGLPATNFEGGRLDLNRKDGTFMNHQGVYFANFITEKRNYNLKLCVPKIS
jgi:fructose-1,6-bisphosphatase/inositol monophosphatase family enzyme